MRNRAEKRQWQGEEQAGNRTPSGGATRYKIQIRMRMRMRIVAADVAYAENFNRSFARRNISREILEFLLAFRVSVVKLWVPLPIPVAT